MADSMATNGREGSYISSGPPPKFPAVFKVTEATGDTVMLVGEHGIVKLTGLDADDVAYFPVGEEFVATFQRKHKHDD